MRNSTKSVIVVVAVLALVIAVTVVTKRSGTGLQADPTDSSQVALGKQVYAAQCASCHGGNLEGQPNWRERNADGNLPAPPHDETGHTWHHPDQQLFDITKRGTAALVGPNYNTDMREFGSILSDEEIWAVLAYIKSTWSPRIQEMHGRMSEGSKDMAIPNIAPPSQ